MENNDNIKFKIIIEVREKSFSWGFDKEEGCETLNAIEAIGALHYTAAKILEQIKITEDGK